ncbi:MAG: hypothetical protein Tp1100DCM00d2C33371621_32 [Prokaryotic dsDNA virus sp.]|nr:MAG: hypothetical protein Tp1100DCM00d2C33371621_32 [Prokaryotic dsDNA virus sp.]|tara:strand:- start:21950 stop:22171 length:222 start_codon:yes stop_codon:yes gene_type:complete
MKPITFEGIGVTKKEVKDFEKGFYDYVEKQRLKQEKKIARIKKQAEGFLLDTNSTKDQIAWANDVLKQLEVKA